MESSPCNRFVQQRIDEAEVLEREPCERLSQSIGKRGA